MVFASFNSSTDRPSDRLPPPGPTSSRSADRPIVIPVVSRCFNAGIAPLPAGRGVAEVTHQLAPVLAVPGLPSPSGPCGLTSTRSADRYMYNFIHMDVVSPRVRTSQSLQGPTHIGLGMHIGMHIPTHIPGPGALSPWPPLRTMNRRWPRCPGTLAAVRRMSIRTCVCDRGDPGEAGESH